MEYLTGGNSSLHLIHCHLLRTETLCSTIESTVQIRGRVDLYGWTRLGVEGVEGGREGESGRERTVLERKGGGIEEMCKRSKKERKEAGMGLV